MGDWPKRTETNQIRRVNSHFFFSVIGLLLAYLYEGPLKVCRKKGRFYTFQWFLIGSFLLHNIIFLNADTSQQNLTAQRKSLGVNDNRKLLKSTFHL